MFCIQGRFFNHLKNLPRLILNCTEMYTLEEGGEDSECIVHCVLSRYKALFSEPQDEVVKQKATTYRGGQSCGQHIHNGHNLFNHLPILLPFL